MNALKPFTTNKTTDPLLIDQPGHSECLLGNEAIVRGAIEAGVGFACGYPGTPSSEVTDSFARIAGDLGIGFEYSVNEKIAIEMTFAASLAGARSICAMKHLGLMVGGDPLSTIPYIGVVGGMVIVSAGDPSLHTSPNEQDQRHLGPMLHIPVLDPSTPEEAYAMTRFAFDLSEQCNLPVLLRTTTRVCHTRAVISYGRIAPSVVRGFQRNPTKYTPVPKNARRMRLEIDGRMSIARNMTENSDFVRHSGSGPYVILASGAPAATCMDVLIEHGVEEKVTLWNIGVVYPLPETKLVECLRRADRVLVAEELTPYIEDAVNALCARHGLACKVLGKRTGHFPYPFEYTPEVIQKGLHDAFGLVPKPKPPPRTLDVLPRPPSLCPGCGHRFAYLAAKIAFGEEQLYFNDIGCYTLGYGPPLDAVDALLCMGAGFTLAAGVSRVTGLRTVGFMGDSTFFHSGMPALLGAIKENTNMVAVILDNEITAMTGFQESPGATERSASIEKIAAALGAEHIETVDPYDLAATIQAFGRARDAKGVSVVVARRVCAVHGARLQPRAERQPAYDIEQDRCRTCYREPYGLRCSQPVTLEYERDLVRRRTDHGRTKKVPDEAPCGAACPLGLCITGYVGHIAAGEYRESMGHILARTALPEVVCRVCHRPCESVCIRSDAPVAINDLKRFVVEWAASQGTVTAECEPLHGASVAVIGAGPSGLSAAHDLRVRGYSVVVFDAKPRPGGILRYGIPEYRLPPDAVDRDIARIFDMGIAFVGEKKLGRDFTLSGLLKDGFDAVYLAIGAHRGRRLALPGAAEMGAPVMIEALEYMLGVRDEGGPVTGRDVVVIGGGNAAVDAARTALRLGGGRVTIGCLERRHEMPALPDEIVAAEEEGISILNEVRPLRCEGAGIVFGSTKAASGAERFVVADQIIVAIGQDPDLTLVDDVALQLDENGCVRIDPETCVTAHPRIFAGGDVASGADRMVTASMAAGMRAAWGIDAALRGKTAADSKVPTPKFAVPEPAPLDTFFDGPSPPRRNPQSLGAAQRKSSFREIVSRLSEVEARAEARRCVGCGTCGNCRACIEVLGCPAFRDDGRIVIDPAICTSCGICVDICHNDAIHLGSAT